MFNTIASIYPCPFDIQERHESNATIIHGKNIYSSEEAKFTTVKQDATTKFPERSLLLGCKELGILPNEIKYWVFPKTKHVISDKVLINFFTYFKIFFKDLNSFKKWKKNNVFFLKHHMMHIALSILSSNFKDAAYISADGGGDDGDPRNFVFGEFKNGNFSDKISFFGKESLASFHAFVSDPIGMSGGENGKTSGLAAYGKHNQDLINNFSKLLIKKKENIFFDRKRFKGTSLNLDKIKPQEYDRGKIMNQYPSFTNVFTKSKKYLPQDIAYAAEHLVAKNFIETLILIKKKTKLKNIVFTGGLFSNVSLNHKIVMSNIFDKTFFCVAPSDAGLSLGGAKLINFLKNKTRFKNLNPYIGPSFSDKEILSLIKSFNLNYTVSSIPEKIGAKFISRGKVIGWFQGRGEIGHRALGNRSILADPRKSNSKNMVNQHLKKRDWFMPYAPAVLEEDMSLFTNMKYNSPYMQVAFSIKKELKSKIRSTIHHDNTARVQSVSKKINKKFWNLINNFKKITGVGAIMNTSFNRHGISTISSPRQAIEHLLEGCMDVLIISKYIILYKENRKHGIKSKKLIGDEENLKNLCKTRFENIKKYLNKKDKIFYLNCLKKVKI